MSEFYVYIYLENEIPYYVGMGQGRRFKLKHNYVSVPKNWDNILMVRNLTQQEAWKLEKVLIASIGMQCRNEGPLKNLRDGGMPTSNGWHHAPKTKERISNSLKGVKKSDKHKQNMKKPNTKAHNEKIRLANLGRARDGREKKIALTMAKKRWFTNGIETKFCEPELVPEDFVPGRKL